MYNENGESINYRQTAELQSERLDPVGPELLIPLIRASSCLLLAGAGFHANRSFAKSAGICARKSEACTARTQLLDFDAGGSGGSTEP